MNDEVRKNLFDVLQAAEEITTFTRSMDFQSYRESAVTQRAVERNFEIIGEALKQDQEIRRNYLAGGLRLIHIVSRI